MPVGRVLLLCTGRCCLYPAGAGHGTTVGDAPAQHASAGRPAGHAAAGLPAGHAATGCPAGHAAARTVEGWRAPAGGGCWRSTQLLLRWGLWQSRS